MTEEEAILAIRLATLGVSNLLCAAKVLDGHVSVFFSLLTKTKHRGTTGGVALFVILGLSSFAINITLRIMLHLEKRKEHPPRNQQADENSIPSGTYISFTAVLLLFVGFVVAVGRSGSEEAFMLTRHALLGLFCAALPWLVIRRNGRMRNYAGRYLKGLAKEIMPGAEKFLRSAKIGPDSVP